MTYVAVFRRLQNLTTGRRDIMPECLLELNHIYKSFGGVKALQDIHLKIYPGEVLCLAGENGCGKSTLIKIISGFYQPDSGQIVLEGTSYQQMEMRDAIKAGIQVVYQDFSIFPNLTVYENIALNTMVVNRKKFVQKREMRSVASEALKKIGAHIPLDALVETLSVADKQLVAISRAILNRAKIIIFDEPTSALTNKEVKELFKVIRHLKEHGISILFVSHKLDEMFDICDRVVVLSNGKNVIDGAMSDFDKKKLVFYMTGKEYDSASLAKDVPHDRPILEVQDLSLPGYFEHISFQIYPGEVLGITGLLGSGRTELAKAIYGLMPAASGNIVIEGEQVSIRTASDCLKHHIAYVPEDRLAEALFMEQSILRNTVLESIPSVSHNGIFDQKKAAAFSFKWIEKLHIKTDNPQNTVSTLSGGNQQKVVLAKSLMTNPKVLILNCPTVGVDIGSKMDINILIQQVAAQGVAIILISDDSSEILTNCHRFLMIKNGKIDQEYLSKNYTESTLYSKLIN